VSLKEGKRKRKSYHYVATSLLCATVALLLIFTPNTSDYVASSGDSPQAANTSSSVAPMRLPVLAYHSIMPRGFYYPLNVNNPWILLDEVFYEHMKYLYENGFTALRTDQLMDFLFYGGDLPEKPVVITFDDGYLDNHLFATPIMREFGFTGMMYLITSTISEITPAMATYPTQYMSMAEIHASMDVFEYGIHTHAMHSHVDGVPSLAAESVERIRADIRKSLEVPIPFTAGFAYPGGVFSDNAISALMEESVRFAFTTQLGYVSRDTNPYMLPRFSVTSDWTPEQFSEIICGRWEGVS